jgi:predicted ATPase
VILLDDLHRAGAALLFLLERLMNVEERQRVLILATAVSLPPQRSSNLADLGEPLERSGHLHRVPLEGLAPAAVEQLLYRLGTPEPAGKAQLLHQVTNGQPFFLGEILRTDDWQQALTDPPASVREFVRRRVEALGEAVEEMLVDAAGLRIAFDVALLAEITGLPQATTAELIDRAVVAGVLGAVGKGKFTFVHELCRRALFDVLDEEPRAQLHYRIATALERRDMPPAVLATHWRWVPGTEAAKRTLRYARLAGDHATLDLDPAAAASWYEIALGVTEDPETRRGLLADVVDARDRAKPRDEAARGDD